MPKSSKPKRREDTPIKADIKIDGNVFNSNIIVGHGNTINIEAIKTASSLFTIPPPVKDFTGREKELEDLKTSFKNGAVITGVSGGGGIGKTELARRLAQEIADDYPSARMSIDLLGTSETPLTSEEVMRRILEPFYPNQKLPDQPEQLQGLYQQTFAAHKSLLLLDNAANAAQVRPLIPPAPSAAIITSRQHFSLTEFDLTPLRLDVPSPEKSREFLRTASSKLKDSPDEEVDNLATLCGYLPLALRVAVSLLNDRADWTFTTLLTRLTDERTRLACLKRDDDIDLDVETIISLSYNLLDDDLKTKFRQLGVFTAPFVRISAQAVWELEDETEADDLLGKLTNRSLINISPSPLGEGGEVPQYILHDLTRLFAINQLLAHDDESKSTVMRQAMHFIDWVSKTNELYLNGNENMTGALLQFRFIWRHLYSVYQMLLPNQKVFPRPPEADQWLSEFPARCPYLLDLHIPPSHKIPILENALNAARRINAPHLESVNLGNLGIVYEAIGDSRAAIELHEKALVIDRNLGSLISQGLNLGNLGDAYSSLGDQKKAAECYEQSLYISRKTGNLRGEASSLGSLGNLFSDQEEIENALLHYEQALAIFQKIGDRRSESSILGNIGTVYVRQGELEKSIEIIKRALDISHELGDSNNESNCLLNLGRIYEQLGKIELAIHFTERAVKKYESIESPHAAQARVQLAKLKGDFPVYDFLHSAIQAHQLKSPKADSFFMAVTRMAVDSNLPTEIQELAKALRSIFAGIQDPDLSNLPDEWAKLIREELGK